MLRANPSERELEEYTEIDVGSMDGPAGKLQRPKPWDTVVRVHRIEVCNLPGGVDEDLIVERSSML